MIKKTTLVLKDQVNCQFLGLDRETKYRLDKALAFFKPSAIHTESFKMGRWDGCQHFATLAGTTYTNLLHLALPVIQAAGYDIELQDERIIQPGLIQFEPIDEFYLSDRIWPAGHRLEGEPIVLTDYQVDSINLSLLGENHQSIQELPTSFGKTILSAALARKVEETTGAGTLTIVPSQSLVEQTYEDFINVGLDAGRFYGKRKEPDHKHVIATWQSLSSFTKKDKRKRLQIDKSFADFLDGRLAVIDDECHSAKAIELQKLLTDSDGMAHFPLRWGISGTIPDEEKAAYDYYAIEAALGPVCNVVKPKELQDRKILATCDIHIKQLKDPPLKFKEYSDAKSYLAGHRERLKWVTDLCKDLQKTGNVLLLFENIETGDIIKEFIPDTLYVTGSAVKSADKRKAIYKSITDDTRSILAATYGVAAVGISVPALRYLVMYESSKAQVRVIQSIGRLLRLSKTIDHGDVYDICSTSSFSDKHMNERMKMYEERGFPFNHEVVDYLGLDD